MEIGKEELIRVNKGFGGNLRSDSSIDFAIEKQDEKKIGEYKKLAYLFRAILVDHPFIDGNKRTAMYLAYGFAEKYNKIVNRDLLIHQITSIAVINKRQIEWRLKNAIN